MIHFYLFLALTALSSLVAGQKAVLFNDTSAWYHWGCTGTSTALKEGIHEAGFDLESFPINLTYDLKSVPSFDLFEDKEKFNEFCASNQNVVASIKQADAVLVNGEGTIHDLRAGPRALLYLAHISKTFFAKHVEIINHSVYPKDLPELSSSFYNNWTVQKERDAQEVKRAQDIYKATYGKLNFVAIREPVSFNEMQTLGISARMSFDCLPLYIRDHYKNPKSVNEKTVVLAGSVAYTEEGAKHMCRYLEALAKQGIKIKILTGAAAFPSKDDTAFINFLKTHCKAKWELVDATSMEEWLDTINHATLFVSGRFHHSIAAFCLNTPFIALNSNTQKVDAICALLEQPTPFHFSDPQLTEKLMVRTHMLLKAPTINNQVKINELCTLAERNFEGLKRLNEKQALIKNY